MGARKGIRAKVMARLHEGPMTGREIEALYIEAGGAVDKRGRVSFDTMRHLMNGLPVKTQYLEGRSRLLDRRFTLDPEQLEKELEVQGRPARSKALFASLLETGVDP